MYHGDKGWENEIVSSGIWGREEIVRFADALMHHVISPFPAPLKPLWAVRASWRRCLHCPKGSECKGVLLTQHTEVPAELNVFLPLWEHWFYVMLCPHHTRERMGAKNTVLSVLIDPYVWKSVHGLVVPRSGTGPLISSNILSLVRHGTQNRKRLPMRTKHKCFHISIWFTCRRTLFSFATYIVVVPNKIEKLSPTAYKKEAMYLPTSSIT